MTYHYIENLEQFHKAVKYISDYCESMETPRIGLDLETYSLPFPGKVPKPIPYCGSDKSELEEKAKEKSGLNLRADFEGHVATMQIGLCPLAGHDIQFIFDVRKLGEKLITEHLKQIIESSLIIGHNLTYEYGFLATQFDIWMVKMRDTLLLGKNIHAGDTYEHTLGNEYRKFLDYGWFYAETGMNFYEYEQFKNKNQKSDWADPNLTKDQLRYAADDVRLIMFLYDQMKKAGNALVKKHKQKGFWDVIRLDCSLIGETALMECRGIPIDVEYHCNNVVGYLEQKRQEAAEAVGEYFTQKVERKVKALIPSRAKNAKPGQMATVWETIVEEHPINCGSPKQVLAALKSVGIDAPNTEEDTLKGFRGDHPGVASILKAKKAAHLSNNFGQKIVDMLNSDGRIRSRFSIVGTKTGRYSSSQINLQQIPFRETIFGEVQTGKLFRTSFQAPEGYEWISADYSQVEPRMIAEISGDPILVKELSREGGDLHGLSAKIFMNMDHQPKKGTYARDFIGKTANLQVFYKAGAKAFSQFMYDETQDLDEPVRWSVPECQEKLDRFFTDFAGVKEAMQEVEEYIWYTLEPHKSLTSFIHRRPVFEMFCRKLPRYEKWCLNDWQEKTAKDIVQAKRSGADMEDIFHRWYKPWDEVKEKHVSWNEYCKMVNRISREAWNFQIQGECANLFKEAVFEVGQTLRALPGIDPLKEGIVSVVHDEINLIVKKERAAEAKAILEKCMISCGEKYITKVPVVVDIKSGPNWSECH